MDRHLHIHILDVLQRNNAIGKMVDIKPAFTDDLITLEARKNFKTQLDYLANEGLIETVGRFDFLTWELLTGLYPLDNKKIEARLAGNWQSYLAKRGTDRRNDIPLLPEPPPPPKPSARLGLYDTPSSLPPYPGVNGNKTGSSPPPVKPTALKAEEEEFEPFKVKNTKAHPDAEKFLKEEDFLPIKVRNANNAQAEAGEIAQPEPELPQAGAVSKATVAAVEPDYGQLLQNEDAKPTETPVANEAKPQQLPPAEPVAVTANPALAATKPEPLKPPAEEPFFTSEAPYTPPVDIQKDDVEPFTEKRTTYIAPRSEVNDVTVTIKPYTPEKPYEAPKLPEKPPRIQATIRRKDTDDADAPIITARTAKRPLNPEPNPAATEPQVPQPAYRPPVNDTPPVTEAITPRAPAVMQPAVAQPLARPADKLNPPPPTSNYAAIRFDTEHNPFNVLGKIHLDPTDEEKKPKKPVWIGLVKWGIIGFIILVLIVAALIYKKRYS